MRQKLRRIVLDGQTFLYRLSHRYEKQQAEGSYKTHYQFRAYLEGFKKSPLILRFETWEDPISGGPLHTGSPLHLADSASPSLNLNQPGHAVLLIRKALAQGWNPSATQRPLEVRSDEVWLEALATTT